MVPGWSNNHFGHSKPLPWSWQIQVNGGEPSCYLIVGFTFGMLGETKSNASEKVSFSSYIFWCAMIDDASESVNPYPAE